MMAPPLSESEFAVLEQVCDAFVPALPAPGADPAEADYYRRGATDRGIPQVIAQALPGLSTRVRDAILALLRELGASGFPRLTAAARLDRLHAAAAGGPLPMTAFKQLRAMTLATFVGAVDDDGTSPVWPVIGYPGPVATPYRADTAPARLSIGAVPAGVMSLDADVCVIGSGAGGAVIAARAAQAGRSVVVLEAGAYRTEADFDQIDSHAADMYLRNGSMWSDNAQLGLLAGSVLGGGTLINSMVCLRTPDSVRQEWARDGLPDLATEAFDKHLDTVWHALNVNTTATSHNANTRAMITGLASAGYRHERLPRNASPHDDPTRCGLCNAGCQLGCKRSVLHTYLPDAVAAGARVIVDCRVDAVTTRDGRATGVRARLKDGREITVAAPTVVVAAGGIESAALLLRSGIGGPAVGRNLRVHPAWIVTGVYDQPVQAWSGQIQSAVSFDLTRCEDGTGFLVESLALNPLTWAGQTPFETAASHRELLRRLPYFATWHGVAHDHGAGEVYLDEDGTAAVRWELADPIDQRVARRAHVELARMHHAAGANEIFTFHNTDQRWRRGEDIDAYLDRLACVPFGEYTAFSAHQMGACRIGTDPATSVADAWGQLHDVPGVWIGDASALPSAPGVNPMITIMAMAERTAEALLTR